MIRPPLQRGIQVNVTIMQVLAEAGLLVRLPDGRYGFIHHSDLIDPLRDYVPTKSIPAAVVDDNPETGRAVLTTAWLDWRALQIDQMVTGRVVDLTDNRVFVDISAEISASIHISQLSDSRRVGHPSEELSVGQKITARVESIDHAQRRIGLSLRAKPQLRR